MRLLLQVLQRLPLLRALDLSGLAQLSDSSAADLAALASLEALDLSGTSFGDTALEVLACAGSPLATCMQQQWRAMLQGGSPGAGCLRHPACRHAVAAAAAAGADVWVPAAQLGSSLADSYPRGLPALAEVGCSQQLEAPALLHEWRRIRRRPILPLAPGAPRCRRCNVRRWQLAGSRVTGAGVAHLLGQQQLDFLDVRGTGITAAELQPLVQRFLLSRVQGAVLARSVAVAAAAVPEGAFVCCCGAGGVLGPAAAVPRVGAGRLGRRRPGGGAAGAAGLQYRGAEAPPQGPLACACQVVAAVAASSGEARLEPWVGEGVAELLRAAALVAIQRY
jgi:hypothetical protein